MKIPSALGMGAIGLLDKGSAISKQFGLGDDDAAKKAAEEEEKKKTAAASSGQPGQNPPTMKRGGSVSRRADGCAQRGLTRGRMC